jgi:hypothetical protein
MGERRHVLGDRQVDALAAKFNTSDFIVRPKPRHESRRAGYAILQKIAGLASGLVGGTRRPLIREEEPRLALIVYSCWNKISMTNPFDLVQSVTAIASTS